MRDFASRTASNAPRVIRRGNALLDDQVDSVTRKGKGAQIDSHEPASAVSVWIRPESRTRFKRVGIETQIKSLGLRVTLLACKMPIYDVKGNDQ